MANFRLLPQKVIHNLDIQAQKKRQKPLF